MSAPAKKNSAADKVTVAVSEEQVTHLAELSAIAKALAAPGRLALVGVLAARFPLPVAVSDLQAEFKRLGTTFDRELGQLAEAGLIEIVEWQPAASGTTPAPALVAFSSAYLRRIPQLITTLHQIERQVHPAAPRPVLSERERILNRFMPGNQVLAWPEPFMQQRYLSEEIVKRFAPDTRYTEREVNAILKEVYAFDYCVVRRSLIDLGLMQRDHGVYWRVG
jgi:hypothetical protein